MSHLDKELISSKCIVQFTLPRLHKGNQWYVDFLDYLILNKDVSAKTRNNYRTWLSTFSTWLTERLYVDTNPVDDIHMLKEDKKFRDLLSVAAFYYCQRLLSAPHKRSYNAFFIFLFCCLSSSINRLLARRMRSFSY